MDMEDDVPPSYEKLIQHERVIVTPNLGANTMEAQVGRVNVQNTELVPAICMDVIE